MIFSVLWVNFQKNQHLLAHFFAKWIVFQAFGGFINHPLPWVQTQLSQVEKQECELLKKLQPPSSPFWKNTNVLIFDVFVFTSNFFILHWGIADWQCYGSFRWIAKGLSHTYTCIQCYVPAWMGGGFVGEWILVYVFLFKSFSFQRFYLVWSVPLALWDSSWIIQTAAKGYFLFCSVLENKVLPSGFILPDFVHWCCPLVSEGPLEWKKDGAGVGFCQEV